MSPKKELTQNEKNLIRRYLIWCYKTTKEELDKVDRYFTQLKADRFILKELRKTKEYRSSGGSQGFVEMVDSLETYMKSKEENVLKKKFKENKVMNPEYLYLQKRFATIEETIRHFLGVKGLREIGLLYEEEMTRRILQAREHA